MIKIGNAAGFWGDDIDAPYRLLSSQPDLNYLTLDYLSEVSMSIMAIQREKNMQLGYAEDFLYVIDTLLPLWEHGSKCKVITNAGGLNPRGLADQCRNILAKEGFNLKIAVIEGDDVLKQVLEDSKNSLLKNLDTKFDVEDVLPRLVTANAYLGAEPIVKALELGADIVIAGRIADPSLTVGPCMYHYKWKKENYNELAGATIAGHLIECGTQVTGGISTHWMEIPNVDNIGYPVAEINEKGEVVITKPPGTGGEVSERTVKEQLLYEIGDPNQYLSPDVSVSFLGLKVKQVGENRVEITGAKGSKPPSTLKVSMTYRDGYKTEANLALFGENAYEKGHKAGDAVLKKVRDAGFKLSHTCVEAIGGGDIAPPFIHPKSLECLLRIAARSLDKEALEYLSKQIAPLVTFGPQGLTGYTTGRSKIRPVFGYWPCLIDAKNVKTKVQILD